MLRAVLLYLSENGKLRDLVLRRRFARNLARRFVAGETLDEAIAVCRAVNARGLSVSLDYLGERVTNRAEAERSVRAYLEALDRVAAEGVDAYISLKLTQLGLDIDEGFCAQKLAWVVHRAAEVGKFVRIDMENSVYGVRRDLQARLVREGFRMRVYVPYGTQWYAYLMRRMAERPANLWFVVRAVWQERGRR